MLWSERVLRAAGALDERLGDPAGRRLDERMESVSERILGKRSRRRLRPGGGLRHRTGSTGVWTHGSKVMRLTPRQHCKMSWMNVSAWFQILSPSTVITNSQTVPQYLVCFSCFHTFSKLYTQIQEVHTKCKTPHISWCIQNITNTSQKQTFAIILIPVCYIENCVLLYICCYQQKEAQIFLQVSAKIKYKKKQQIHQHS